MTRLEQLRRDAGLSTKALGEHAGVSHMTVSRLERRKVQPHPFTAKAIADALTRVLDRPVSVSELLEDATEREAA